MTMLYKYVDASYFDKIFPNETGGTFKCSYPKDFNDPYELFLTVEFDQDPEGAAFYEEIVGKLQQLPTTCFSRSPTVIPMWAHYARNHSGIVIEFSEEKLKAAFPQGNFDNVTYRDTPLQGLKSLFDRAQYIGKPRYFHMLQNGLYFAAYFTKTTAWAYELDRRMILNDSEMRKLDGLMLMDVPAECITSITVGARASIETKRLVEKQCNSMECDYIEMRIGRSSATPFFINESGDTIIFDGEGFQQTNKYCQSCKEPTTTESEKCSWCGIEESHRKDAAGRNTYRILQHHGLLERYIESMQEIDRRHGS
ncbi:hypothetical protein KP729_000772|uniref:DUF2971 domain-containing protein n=1 Tax=Delftia acidovorans TaxID=80866 RepID=UPI001C0C3FF7|nr:DUF2971 domain-containing protein [Delftia acidovorans]MCA1067424.1 hypothetical protein [Delftia acidovorans]